MIVFVETRKKGLGDTIIIAQSSSKFQIIEDDFVPCVALKLLRFSNNLLSNCIGPVMHTGYCLIKWEYISINIYLGNNNLQKRIFMFTPLIRKTTFIKIRVKLVFTNFYFLEFAPADGRRPWQRRLRHPAIEAAADFHRWDTGLSMSGCKVGNSEQEPLLKKQLNCFENILE